MIIDLKRCIGCDACTLACKAEQGTPPNIQFARISRTVYGKYPDVQGFFLPVLCNHCENPACKKACPSHAISQTKEGLVLVNDEKCVGARACVAACPYHQAFFPDDDRKYFGQYLTKFEEYHQTRRKSSTAIKCTFCSHNLAENKEPACVRICPTECRLFGDLDDPNSNPNQYLKKRSPEAEPVPLRPEAGTKPKVLYLL